MEWFNQSFFQWFKIIVCMFLVGSGSIQAAERLSLKHLSFNELQQRIAVPFIQSASPPESALKSDLSLVEQHTDSAQIEHIRVQQRYAEIPIFGGQAILHHKRSSLDPMSIKMNGIVYQKLQEDLGERPEWFLENAHHALHRYKAQFQQSLITDAHVTPVIYVDKHQKAYWAYQVSLFLQHAGHMPSRPTAIISAKDDHVFVHWNDLPTLRNLVHGLGYGGNIKMGKYQFGKDFPFLELIRDDNFGKCYLENANVRVVDMAHRIQQPNAAMSFDCEDALTNDEYWTGYDKDGYDRSNGAYAVANDAMYMGTVVKEMYRNQYGQEVLYNGQNPMQLIMRVHYSTHYANAFWDGKQMTFGDGDGFVHPLVSLGITAHEVSHGFTQQHSGLVYHGQSGGMNESFSDMAAQASEYYAHGQASWLIGADILKQQGALRFLKKPSRDGLSIDRADQYKKGMDVHYSSGVYNNLFYTLAHRPDWDTSKAFRVMMKANMDYWTPTSTFEEGACGILSASNDLGFNEDDVMIALDEVMIDYSDCESST